MNGYIKFLIFTALLKHIVIKLKMNVQYKPNDSLLRLRHLTISGLVKYFYNKMILLIDFSPSLIEDYEKQIHQLQQKLSQNNDERTLLRERLNEVELELSKTSDDRTSTLAMYEKQFESLVQERDVLFEQQALQSAEK